MPRPKRNTPRPPSRRNNKIIDVNERHAYALVEPGVSYFYLHRHIHGRKLKAATR